MYLSRCSIIILLAIFAVVLPAAAWEISAGSNAAPGDRVTLAGGPPAPADPLVIVWGVDGATLLDGLKSTPEGLEGTLGPVATPFVGHAELWRGKRFSLPIVAVNSHGHTFAVQSADAFVGVARDGVGGALGVTGTSPLTWASAKTGDGGGVEIPIPPIAFGPVMPSIRVDIIIDGGTGSGNNNGASNNPGGGNTNGETGKLIVATLNIDIVPGAMGGAGGGPTPIPAAGLAQVLKRALAPLGIDVSTDGIDLRFNAFGGEVERGLVLIHRRP
ncbi:MAG: hypothetical protein AAGM22_04535 [Acidobacteriota bacterium]